MFKIIRRFSISILFVFSIVQVFAQNTLDLVGLGSGTPASAAFSLRKLSSSYTGPLVRVLVGSSFYDVYPDATSGKFATTSNISAAIGTYNAAVSASTASTLSSIISGNNAFVAIWYDQRGTGSVNLIQDVAASRPKIVSSGSIITHNSMPAIELLNPSPIQTFNSAATNLYQSQDGTTFAPNLTISVIFSSSAILSTGRLINIGGKDKDGYVNFGGINNKLSCLTNASGTSWNHNTAFSEQIDLGTSSVPLITTTTIEPANPGIQAFVNGTATSKQFNGNFNSVQRFSLGATFGSSSSVNYTYQNFIGKVSEVIFLPSILNSTNRQALECSQSIFSGISTSNSCAPTITTAGTSSTCYSANVQTTSLSYSATSGSPTSYSIDWDNTANSAGFRDQLSTSYTFSSGGGTITGINVPAALASGTYSGTMTISNGSNTGTTAVTLTVSASPTLGTYSSTTVIAGQNASITPTAAPTNSTSIVAYTSTNFSGTLTVNPTTGVVSVTNAKQAGTHLVTVKAFSSAGCTATTTFTLTVSNPNCSQGNFTGTTEVIVGTAPTSIAIGDFNGDGKQDIAAANYSSASVSIRLGDGTGGFSGSTNVGLGTNPYSVAIGDFNGDGKQDVAVAIRGSTTVSIRLGDGTGGFSDSTEVSVGTNPYSVVIGDFNGDGKQDIAAANYNSASVSIRLGDGTGGFSGSTEVSVGTYPTSLEIGDFSGDGKQDIAVANSGSATVSIRLGDGAGGFSGSTNVGVGFQPWRVAIGDFNGDGNQDIATANSGSTTVSIRLGNGSGGFSGTTEVNLGTAPVSVAIGDFNGDGKQDIAASNYSSASVSILLGNGNGEFSGSTNVPVETNPGPICIGDFNRDGKHDIAVANGGSTTVSIRLSAGSPTFTAQPGATAGACTDVTYTTESGQSNYVWTVPGTLNTDYTITSGGLGTSSNTVTLKWLTAGSKIVTINYTNSNGCTAATATSSTATTVNTNNTGAASSSPTVCVNTALTNITHATTGATGIGTAAGLPAGVSAAWSSNTITISGTPTATGTFTYSIPLTGGCGTVNATGTITVSPVSVGGTASTSSGFVTSGGTTILALSGHTGSIQWQQSSNGSSGWTNVTGGSGATASSYTTASLSTTTYFRALVTSETCTSASSNVVSVIVSSAAPVSSVLAVVVGGGGGGGAATSRNAGGGGGSGGAVVTNSSIQFSPGVTYTITVGTGGSFQNNGSSSSISGSDITTITAAGGIKGSNASSSTGGTGGTNGTAYGAGGKGMNYQVNATNNGAAGVYVTELAAYYGGGGGGGNYAGSPGGYGQYGSGATGTGAVNDGGGARGQNANLTSGLGAYGTAGPGVVIIRYASNTPLISGGTITTSTTGGTTYQIHTYTSYTTVSLLQSSNTVTTASATPTVCLNGTLTNITHTTTGATGIGTPDGLPAGVTAAWSSNTITISGTPTVSGTFTYSIPLTGGSGSVNATGTIYVSEPSITLQPETAAQTVCQGAVALTVEAYVNTGSISSYKWYSNASASNSGGTQVANNSTTSTSNSYNPTATGYYYAVVTDASGCTATSDVSGLVTITPSPAISSQPSSSLQSICINGSPTALSVTASAGSGSIKSYKWYSNTSNSTSGGTLVATTPTSATTNSYTPVATSAGTLYYYCVITNTNDCSITSTVSGAVTVVTSSVGGTASASTTSIANSGTTVLTLTGNSGSIQWQQSANGSSGWSNVSDGSGSTYTTATLSTSTYFRATVTNGSCAVAYSNTLYISVYTVTTGDVLVVSGGGSGASSMGGGGGGGAVKYFTNQTLSGSVAVVVGAGGASVTAANSGGNPGESSSFGSLVATSGASANSPSNGGGGGGSGGGRSGNFNATALAGGVAISGMGNNGGSGIGNTVNFYAAASGGGGGAGGAGGNGNNNGGSLAIGGNGGPGIANSITGISVTYGGGGGGGVAYNASSSGAGGSGGGSAGTKGNVQPADATPNTGGGGGGMGEQNGGRSGAGGSGVVIVRYPGTVATATGGTITIASGYVVHKFTSSGTFVWTGGSPTTSITSTGSASACYSASAQTATLAYTASTGSPTSYSIDWNAAANTAGLADQASTTNSFAAGGGSISDIAIPAGLAAGTYTGTMTITNGSSTTTQAITLSLGSASGTISGSGSVASGTNSTILTLSGYTGSILWQSSSNNSTFSTIGSATSATYTATNLTATTFYKAVVTNGVCASATSNTATITVSSPSTSFSIAGTGSALATTNNTATVVDNALVVTANGTISGFTVTITGDYTEGDVLGYTGSLPSGISALPFDVTSRSLYFTGSASAADWQTLLRTVTFTSTSSCFPTNRKVSFLPSNKYYNYFNGHYYEFVSTPLSWPAAKAAAASRSFYGRKGYLVTISSEAENNYVWKLINSNSWIGLSCLHTEINSALGYNRFESTTYGQFYWVTGPEKGTAVSNGLNTNLVQIPGVYSNWRTAEPNNYLTSGENSGHMLGGTGKWNDYWPGGANFGRAPIPYIVEFGGSQGDDTTSAVSFTRDITISGSPAGTVSGASIVCNGTNSTTLTYSGGGTIQRWEYSTDNFATAATPVSSISSTLSVTNLSSSRYYRVVVNNGSCIGMSSSAALIQVVSTTAGTISSTTANVCAGGDATLTLNGNTGSIQNWQVSTTSDFSTGNTTINSTSNTINYNLSSDGIYYFRAAVLNSVCTGGSPVYTEGYPVVATSGGAPVGGSVNSVAYCGGSNSGTLTLSGSTGTSYQWEVSTDGGLVYADASSTTTTLNYSAVSTTTKYRVLVTGGCGSVYSSIGTITVGGTSGAQWTGGTSTDWGNTANWCGYIIGDDGLDVEISATATYAPTLDRSRSIGNLNFNSSGKSVTLGNYTLTASSITGASSSNYVKTTGTGKLQVTIGNGITTSLPVGNAAYNPVSITNNNTASDYFSVRVLDEVYANSVSGTLSSNGRVKRTWDISKTNANGGSGLNFVFNWNAGETTGLTVPSLFAYSSGNWVKQTGTTSYSSTSLTYTGYTGTLTSFAMLQGIYTWAPAGINNLWSNGNNWSTGSAPAAGAEIVISSGTPLVDADYAVSGSLTLSGTGTLTINAGKTLSVPSGGVADFGGKLVTFKSDATGTGQLGTVAGTLSNATNITVERHIPAGKRAFRFFGSPVTTTTTIQQNWMEGATPGVLTGYPYRTVSAYNPNLGYGTLITGTGGNANGFDASQTNNPSLFTFNNSTGAWVTVTNTTTTGTISAGSAYRLFVRGDRSYGITASSEPPGGSTILRTTGTIVTGELTTGSQLPALSQAASGWSLIGNPYQSVVDMSSADVVKTNLTPYYYVWDPRQSTRGAYVAYNYSLNTSSNNASAVNRYVQPGQAFFVQNTTAGSNSLVFKEAAKGAVANQTATFARNNTRAGGENGYTIDATAEKAQTTQTQAANYASLSAVLYYTDSLATGAAAADATRAIFGSQFSNLVDVNDGRKFTNLDETMAIKQGTNLLSMELRSLPDSSTIIPLNITQYVDKKYTMRLFWDEKLNTDTLVAYLRDRYTNKETEVKKTGNTDVEYILDADAKSSAADRFEIIFRSTRNQVTAVINYDNGQYIKIYPNPVQSMLNIDFDLGQNRLVDMKVYDMTGRLVLDRPGMRKGSGLTMTGLAKGTYSVKIWGSDGRMLMSEKIIKD